MSARAAAIVPRLPDGRVLVGTRTRHARSWPGTLAFPGGGCEDTDAQLPLLSGHDRARACGLRELGEEVGLWRLCRPDGSHDAGAHAAAVAAILDRVPLARALTTHGLVLDDRDLTPLLLWRTWDGRFAVQQFMLTLADEPARAGVLLDELTDLHWAQPRTLRDGWRDGEVFLIAPIRRVIVELARHDALDTALPALRAEPNAVERARADLVEGVCLLSAKTPTLPPATHTNSVLLGTGDALLVDPATPWAEEQDRFDRHLAACLGRHKVSAIVCTHHHHDHVGDVARLRERLRVPVWAHAQTAERVDFPVDRLLDDGEVLECPGSPGNPSLSFRVVFTPGHAPGHICLFEERTRLLVAGDMVAGVGSILIDPPEGHMGTYLASMGRLIGLAPRGLIPSHGPLLVDGTARLEEQVAHRGRRQESILATVLESGPEGLRVHDIVQRVYGADTPAGMFAFAERSVVAALELCVERGQVRQDAQRFIAVRAP